MSHRRQAFGAGLGVVMAMAGAAMAVHGAAPAGSAPPPPGAEQAKARYDRIADSYLHSKWDDLAEALKVPPKELAAMTAEQRADIAYVRKAWAEVRPPWWKLAKQTKKAGLRVSMGDRNLLVTYSPADKPGSNMSLGAAASAEVSWNPSGLDSTEPAGGAMAAHGCTVGDLAEADVWITLANVYFMAGMPPSTLTAAYQRDKEQLGRCQAFHSHVMALYHCSPGTRNALLISHLAAFMPKYGTGPLAGTQRAIGSAFVATVLADPAKWPSLSLPDKGDGDDPEDAAAVHYKMRIGKAWTIAEDRALRDAFQTFYKANAREVLKDGKVTLPNGLTCMIDDPKDREFKPKRNEWVAKQLEKAKAG